MDLNELENKIKEEIAGARILRDYYQGKVEMGDKILEWLKEK